MNILFVNYGDFTSNSLNHIGAFANQLTLLGHSCVVAVPDNPDSISVIGGPLFIPVTFARALQSEPPLFPDRRPADLVHAWTPRENVREFTLAFLRKNPSAALIVHLEDNEVFLAESFARMPLAKLRELSDEELALRLSPRLSHPIRFGNFLRIAHGGTYITDRLREFLPSSQPSHRLLPGIDDRPFRAAKHDLQRRAELGVQPGEKLIVFPGSTTFANLADIRALLLAVRLINERGVPCRLIRAGINPPEYARELAAAGGDYVIDLGFIPKSTRQLEPLLALADLLVQPGAADAFNDFRLPSKIPEFAFVGRPLVVPRANIGREMIDGQHALLLDSGTPAEIADKCIQIFGDTDLATRLSAGALEFARTHFDLATNTRELLDFYQEVARSATPLFRESDFAVSEDVLVLGGDTALRMRAKELTIAADHEKIQLLEKSLEAARQRTLSLEGIVAMEQARNNRLSAQENYQRAKLQSERSQREMLVRQLADAAEANARLNCNLDEAHQRVEARDVRIEQLRRSFSWQITSPLRSLRRLLVDPFHKPSPAPARPLPKPDPGLRHAIDEPTDWKAIPPSGTLRGWVISSDSQGIVGVRVRFNRTAFNAIFGLMRADLTTAFPGHPHAGLSGFTLEYAVEPNTDQTLILEALTVDGRWRCFASNAARVVPESTTTPRHDYGSWIRAYDTLTLEKSVALQARLEALAPPQRPLISVLMPVYNTPAQWLNKAIESVVAQLYPQWELCIADDASTEPHVRPILDEWVRRDPRVRVTYREQNGHISHASNSALELVRGEFIALFDHDDELAPDALAEVVLALAARADADVIYSDEDKIDELGQRFWPYFKPDFLPDLLAGQNFVSHLSVLRTTLVRGVGGFRPGYEGSQDWDLLLRVIEKSSPDRVQHIPKVLYHWRAISGSTARAVSEKDYSSDAARRALLDHFERRKLSVEIRAVTGSHWQIVYPRPQTPPLVSIIIPTHNGENLLRLSVGSLFAKTTYPNFEVIVVDNRSDDPATLAYLGELERSGVRVLKYPEPFNFSAINNFAVKHARGEVVCLCNNDIEVITPEWLEEMVSHAVRPEIGAVGAMLYYPNDTIQHAGIVLGLGGVANHAFLDLPRGTEGYMNRGRLVQNYSAVTGACLVVRRAVYEQVGGLNEKDLAIAFNDVDFCLRVRAAGYRNLWTPFAEFYHHESASRGKEDTAPKQARFVKEVEYMRRTWGDLLDHDPAYNSNLATERESFALAFPPRSRR